MSQRPSVRVFTVAEANALLPRFNVLLERQARIVVEIDAAFDTLRTFGHTTRSVLEDADDHPEVARLKARVREIGEDVKKGLVEIESTGAVVKDVRKGLLDFHGRRDEKLVWLCWQYGEPAVAHWHPLDQGFPARKPLERLLVPRTMN